MWTRPRKTRVRHGAADERGRDVVEERREHEDHHEQHEGALSSRRAGSAAAASGISLSSKCRASRANPSSRPSRLTITTHSCPRWKTKPARPAPVLESRKQELVERDHREAGERHLERAVVEERDAEQRQREQDELEWNAGDLDRLRCDCGRECSGQARQGERQTEHPKHRPTPARPRRHRYFLFAQVAAAPPGANDACCVSAEILRDSAA